MVGVYYVLTEATGQLEFEGLRLHSGKSHCKDGNGTLCAHLASEGGCTVARLEMKKLCPKTCGLCGGQVAHPSHAAHGTTMSAMPPANLSRTQPAGVSLTSPVQHTEKPAEGSDHSPDKFEGCTDKHRECARWAKYGECTGNPHFSTGAA